MAMGPLGHDPFVQTYPYHAVNRTRMKVRATNQLPTLRINAEVATNDEQQDANAGRPDARLRKVSPVAPGPAWAASDPGRVDPGS